MVFYCMNISFYFPLYQGNIQMPGLPVSDLNSCVFVLKRRYHKMWAFRHL